MNDTHYRDYISTVAEIIDEARNGRMFILVDHENRENEGDLVIPAQMATPDAVNFMATHGRGLICLAMEADRLDALGLPMMAPTNQSRHETAFTVSIEAREGITTGISAHDRAHTIAVAIDPRSTPADIAIPGHVFPLRAREGGVLMRAGHTEAAVDIARLAGQTPAGVICEVMNDDGSMARLPDLVAFAERHCLKIGTISDLIAYRRQYDNLVRQTVARTIHSTIGGDWEIRIFHDLPGGAEHIALIKGKIDDGQPVLVRMHALDPLEDLLALHPDRWQQVPDSMAVIAAEGRGAVVILRDMSATSISTKLKGHAASPKALRQYGVGAEILGVLGVSELVMLSNSPPLKVVGLDGYGITIVGTRPIPKRGG